MISIHTKSCCLEDGFSCSVTCFTHCQNGGTYQDGACVCANGYSGTHFEMVIDLDVRYRLKKHMKFLSKHIND